MSLVEGWGIAESVILGLIAVGKFAFLVLLQRMRKAEDNAEKWEEKFRNNDAKIFDELKTHHGRLCYLEGFRDGQKES